ncbi:XRE family transcriptional regulator [Conexibacter woesei]|uniref:Transcriptional regulator, XRE family n=1 Tax=Conexibacter woesei (strain DSM 14684 / CCUG 47730 / CIP 108061 / JCM 11494 / NBRC 100937 / ID131577) TaxID=469383 RepID=D3EZW1_CONWI|nr:XRE family transcriptional regulator [Conexibacter woesei]ADB49937.1 transcriptional regulator, XRE family [Conexibacter woesei DSM 14684]
MPTDLPDPPLGPRLRELRRRRGLSIKAAADRAGISASFLSLVEREQSDLAMSRLMRLLQLYGATLTELIGAEPRPPSDIVRHGEELHILSPGEHIDAYLLVADTDRPLVPMIWVYAPGAGMEEPIVPLTDQFSYVIDGAVAVETDDGTERLGPGDTIYMRAGRRYRIHNDAEQPARLLGCGIGVAGPPPAV